MGILQENAPCYGEVESQSRCKPDYEAMIAKARKRIAKANALQDALMLYTGGAAGGYVAEMFGVLYCEILALNERVHQLIREQEESAK